MKRHDSYHVLLDTVLKNDFIVILNLITHKTLPVLFWDSETVERYYLDTSCSLVIFKVTLCSGCVLMRLYVVFFGFNWYAYLLELIDNLSNRKR